MAPTLMYKKQKSVKDGTNLSKFAIQTANTTSFLFLSFPYLDVEDAPVTYDPVRGTSSSEVRAGCKN